MAKPDPSETTGPPGPVRTSSGTRPAVRFAPLEPSVVSQPSANDIHGMPTRQLDLDQLRAMALHCASDVGHVEEMPRATLTPPAEKPMRARLELVLTADEEPLNAAVAPLRDDAAGSRRSGGLALIVVALAFAMAFVAAFAIYGVSPR